MLLRSEVIGVGVGVLPGLAASLVLSVQRVVIECDGDCCYLVAGWVNVVIPSRYVHGGGGARVRNLKSTPGDVHSHCNNYPHAPPRRCCQNVPPQS